MQPEIHNRKIRYKYLVKWQKGHSKYNTWETRNSLKEKHHEHLIEKYLEKKRKNFQV